jgi:hypothetical protein
MNSLISTQRTARAATRAELYLDEPIRGYQASEAAKIYLRCAILALQDDKTPGRDLEVRQLLAKAHTRDGQYRFGLSFPWFSLSTAVVVAPS